MWKDDNIPPHPTLHHPMPDAHVDEYECKSLWLTERHYSVRVSLIVPILVRMWISHPTLPRPHPTPPRMRMLMNMNVMF